MIETTIETTEMTCKKILKVVMTTIEGGMIGIIGMGTGHKIRATTSIGEIITMDKIMAKIILDFHLARNNNSRITTLQVDRMQFHNNTSSITTQLALFKPIQFHDEIRSFQFSSTTKFDLKMKLKKKNVLLLSKASTCMTSNLPKTT